MAKATVYLRVAKRDNARKPFTVEASMSPSTAPIIARGSYNKPDVYLPTIAFGITLDLPDSLFNQAERVIGEINVAADKAAIAASVEVPALEEKTSAKRGRP